MPKCWLYGGAGIALNMVYKGSKIENTMRVLEVAILSVDSGYLPEEIRGAS